MSRKLYEQNVSFGEGAMVQWTPLDPFWADTDEEATKLAYENVLDKRVTWMLVEVRAIDGKRTIRHVHSYDARKGAGHLREVKTR